MRVAGPWATRMALASAMAAVPYSYPQTDLVEEWHADHGLQIDTTLASYGSLTPIPTLSGSIVHCPIWLGIRTGATLGGGLYNLSLNGGSILPIQNQALPGGGTVTVPGTSMVVTFPAGSYTTNATYTARVLQWVGRKGAFTWVQDAGQPSASDRGPLLTAFGRTNDGLNRTGRGCMGKVALSTASNGYLVEMGGAGGFANTLAGGTNKPFHVFWVGSFDANISSATAQTMLGLGRNASDPRITFGDNTTSTYQLMRRNDAASNANQFINSGTGGTALTSFARRVYVFEVEFDGTTTTLRRNGVVTASGNQSGGAVTLTQACLFALKRSTLTSNAQGTCRHILAYGAAKNSTDAAQIRASLRAEHDVLDVKTINVAIEGASLSDVSRSNLTWANVMLFGNDIVTVSNIASIGASLTGTMLPRAAAAGAGTFDFYYNAGLPAGNNIAFLWVEANGLNVTDGSGNLATEKSNTTAWVSGRQATGWRVIVKTLLPHGSSSTFNTKRLDYNDWLRSGASGADFVDDQASRWPYVPGDNIGYDIGDNIHVGLQGASHIAYGAEYGYRYLSSLAA